MNKLLDFKSGIILIVSSNMKIVLKKYFVNTCLYGEKFQSWFNNNWKSRQATLLLWLESLLTYF